MRGRLIVISKLSWPPEALAAKLAAKMPVAAKLAAAMPVAAKLPVAAQSGGKVAAKCCAGGGINAGGGKAGGSNAGGGTAAKWRQSEPCPYETEQKSTFLLQSFPCLLEKEEERKYSSGTGKKLGCAL